MRIPNRSRRIETPSGDEWRVGRQWTSRGLPRLRRLGLRRSPERTLDAASSIPAVDVGNLEGLELFIGGVVAAIVIAVILIPLLLFGVELIVAGLFVAGSIVARSALGRPWIVHATPCANPAGTLAWGVKGWQHSEELIEKVVAELAAGLVPSPTDGSEQLTPGSS